MTASLVDTITLDYGGTNQLTVYPTDYVKERYQKTLVKINPGKSTQKTPEGADSTIILDLLRLEKLIEVVGYIDSADRQKFRNLVNIGGVDNSDIKYALRMIWDGITWEGVIEGAELNKLGREEQDEWGVHFTFVAGVKA